MRHLNRAVQVIALCGALVLSACGGPSASRDMYKSGNSQVPRKATTRPIKPEIAAPRRELSAQQLASIRAFGLDKDPKPAQLIGLSQFDIQKTLGEPSFVRKDQGVEIWQYKDQSCILDIFLYEKPAGLIVNHTELRGPILDSAGGLECYKRLLIGQS
jgi:hypothetical protein